MTIGTFESGQMGRMTEVYLPRFFCFHKHNASKVATGTVLQGKSHFTPVTGTARHPLFHGGHAYRSVPARLEKARVTTVASNLRDMRGMGENHITGREDAVGDILNHMTPATLKNRKSPATMTGATGSTLVHFSHGERPLAVRLVNGGMTDETIITPDGVVGEKCLEVLVVAENDRPSLSDRIGIVEDLQCGGRQAGQQKHGD